jgi:hypothetical protein
MSSSSISSMPDSMPLLRENRAYGAINGSAETVRTIRFQVLIWYIGKLDVVTGSVPMTFRVTLFWNDLNPEQEDILTVDGTSTSSINVWKMHGRQKAYESEMKGIPMDSAIDVPPLSILNVATFEIIGSPEVEMLRDNTRLMRWTAMYRATVVQDNLTVEHFPHDSHEIGLKLAILSHRSKGRQWDRRIWKLALATADDNQNSTRVPHGLIVDQVNIPDFEYNKERGAEFQFCSLAHGSFDPKGDQPDTYLKVSVNVLRQSGYYDNNIVPLLALLNVVAVSVLTLEDREFFNRGLLTMNIAFVEIGIRMTADSHLPSVGYEIRLQRILNEFFCVLMFLVLEAMLVYVMREYYGIPQVFAKAVDWITGISALLHNLITVVRYYDSQRQAHKRLHFGWKTAKKERRS